MEWWMYPLVVMAGIGAGFINTLAGSGSLITLPLLLFIGLDANTANGTNRIGILIQNVVGVSGFRQQRVFELREATWLSAPALVGALLGAYFAIGLQQALMEKIIALLLLLMFFIILLKPEAWLREQAGHVLPKPGALQLFIFFAVGFYGGFIQVGVGFFILAGLVLGAGVNLLKANALKLIIVLIYTPLALVVFMYYGEVDYWVGLILALGNGLGAWLATHVAVKWGAAFVRWVLLSVILGSVVKLLLF